MLVTRKKNSVRNGWSGSLLRNELKGEVNQKGIFVHGKENFEGASVKSNKGQVLSNLPDQARAVSDVSAQGETQNGDMRNLVISFSAASPKQGVEVMRTDGKYHHGSSSTITRGNRFIGAKGSKSLKRQHPSSSQRASSSKSEQIRENGGKPSESVQFNKEWLGGLAPKQLDRGTR